MCLSIVFEFSTISRFLSRLLELWCGLGCYSAGACKTCLCGLSAGMDLLGASICGELDFVCTHIGVY